MKVCVKPTGLHSIAMLRVAAALVAAAPKSIEFVDDPAEADLQVVHAIGFDAKDQVRAPAYAVIQYCGWASRGDAGWQPLWQDARFVWSYYDLDDALPAGVPFMHAPLGIDEVFRQPAPGRPPVRSFDLLTMGFSTGPIQEAIEECAWAVQAVGGHLIHVGPKEIEGMVSYPPCWQTQLHVPDATLRQLYRSSARVGALRHVEGFELPGLEGLLCGARPIVFDRPDMRQWYEGLAEFVPECDGQELIERLTALLRTPPAPVTDAERARVLTMFHWPTIATRFWSAVERTAPVSVAAGLPSASKRRLLWIGDAGASTGFERGTRHICHALMAEFDVHVLGLNHNGDPTPQYAFPVYPCHSGGDPMGYGRVQELVERLGPAAIVIQNDPWNFPGYLARTGNVPVIGYVAVDGENIDGTKLAGLASAIFWTAFGERQARVGGYSGPTAVIPLGVDLATYAPQDKAEAKRRMLGQVLQERGLPPDTFIVGALGRNQWRKRLDLTLEYFARWVHDCQVRDAVLWLQSAPTSDDAFNLAQLVRYWNIADRVLMPQVPHRSGMSEETLARVYAMMDALFVTTLGEGFHLPSFEAMACGTPVIAPDWSALGEFLADGGGWLVPCTTTAAHPRSSNSTIGGVMDRALAIRALDDAYRHADARRRKAEEGLALVRQERFRWDRIGERFLDEVRRTLTPWERVHVQHDDARVEADAGEGRRGPAAVPAAR